MSAGYKPFLHTKIVHKKDRSRFARNIWRTWGRPVLAYIGACLVASFVLCLTYSVVEYGFADDMVSRQMFGDTLGSLLFMTAVLTPFMVIIAALPAILMLFLANLRGWPRGRADALAGAVVPVILFGLFMASQYVTLASAITGLMTGLTLAPAGLIGGLTYWWLAGRPTQSRRPVLGTG